MNTESAVAVWLNNLFGLQFTEGRCAFVYDERIELSIEVFEDERSIYLYAPVATIPAENKEAFYEELLSLNNPGGELRGACLSLDKSKQSVLLWYAQPLDNLDIEGFQNMLGSFLDMADRLWNRFDTGRKTERPSGPLPEDLSTTDSRGFDVFRP
jgi:hypothetical protein